MTKASVQLDACIARRFGVAGTTIALTLALAGPAAASPWAFVWDTVDNVTEVARDVVDSLTLPYGVESCQYVDEYTDGGSSSWGLASIWIGDGSTEAEAQPDSGQATVEWVWFHCTYGEALWYEASIGDFSWEGDLSRLQMACQDVHRFQYATEAERPAARNAAIAHTQNWPSCSDVGAAYGRIVLEDERILHGYGDASVSGTTSDWTMSFSGTHSSAGAEIPFGFNGRGQEN